MRLPGNNQIRVVAFNIPHSFKKNKIKRCQTMRFHKKIVPKSYSACWVLPFEKCGNSFLSFFEDSVEKKCQFRNVFLQSLYYSVHGPMPLNTGKEPIPGCSEEGMPMILHREKLTIAQKQMPLRKVRSLLIASSWTSCLAPGTPIYCSISLCKSNAMP